MQTLCAMQGTSDLGQKRKKWEFPGKTKRVGRSGYIDSIAVLSLSMVWPLMAMELIQDKKYVMHRW